MKVSSPEKIRKQFPILQKNIHGSQLIYLDNAATTQKPQSVITALSDYYSHANANIHRGVHYLSELATEFYETSRKKIQNFIQAPHSKECIFTRSTTEAINLVAFSYGEAFVHPGDEIIISAMEHHSNIVPWQMLCKRKQATLKILPMKPNGELKLEVLDSLLTTNTKLLALTHVSNSLGTINPIKQIIEKAHNNNIPVLVDGAQALPHLTVNVQELDCDFYAFSSHKMYGPMGIGVLYGKEKWLNAMPPYQSGGNMILSVDFKKTTYKELPFKFEAGTMPVGNAIAFGATLDFLDTLDLTAIWSYELELLQYAKSKLSEIPGLKLIGDPKERISILPFTLDNIHSHDIGTILDQSGIAIRTGHHCTMPIMDFLKISSTSRASFGIYNTFDEIDLLHQALIKINKIFLR